MIGYQGGIRCPEDRDSRCRGGTGGQRHGTFGFTLALGGGFGNGTRGTGIRRISEPGECCDGVPVGRPARDSWHVSVDKRRKDPRVRGSLLNGVFTGGCRSQRFWRREAAAWLLSRTRWWDGDAGWWRPRVCLGAPHGTDRERMCKELGSWDVDRAFVTGFARTRVR